MPQPISACISTAENAESYAVETQASVAAIDESLRDRLEMAVTILQHRRSRLITTLTLFALQLDASRFAVGKGDVKSF